MRTRMRIDIAVGRRQRREAQRVGRGAGGHDEGPHRGAEELTEGRIQLQRPGIIAVGFLRTIVGGREGGQQFRGDARGVVAVERVGVGCQGHSGLQRKEKAPTARNTRVVPAR